MEPNSIHDIPYMRGLLAQIWDSGPLSCGGRMPQLQE